MEFPSPSILSIMPQKIHSLVRPFWPLLITGFSLVFIRFWILPCGWEECGVIPATMTFWQQGWQLWPDLIQSEAWHGPAETSVLWLVLVGYPVYFLSEGGVLFCSLRWFGRVERAVYRTVLMFIAMRLLQGFAWFLPLWTAWPNGQGIHSVAAAFPLIGVLLSALLAGGVAPRDFYPFSTFFKGP